uniref:Uncharacterized protein n=1 Tax=Anopheles albimanus TaxID=7167 RepID=A0A182F5N1_ANOAL
MDHTRWEMESCRPGFCLRLHGMMKNVNRMMTEMTNKRLDGDSTMPPLMNLESCCRRYEKATSVVRDYNELVEVYRAFRGEMEASGSPTGTRTLSDDLTLVGMLFPIQEVEQLHDINELARDENWRSVAVTFLVDRVAKCGLEKKPEIRMAQAIFGTNLLAKCSWVGFKRVKGDEEMRGYKYSLQRYFFVNKLYVEATKKSQPNFDEDGVRRVLQQLCLAATKKLKSIRK